MKDTDIKTDDRDDRLDDHRRATDAPIIEVPCDPTASPTRLWPSPRRKPDSLRHPSAARGL
jgi:hypothetical protein